MSWVEFVVEEIVVLREREVEGKTRSPCDVCRETCILYG
jgi:hypothetical protein